MGRDGVRDRYFSRRATFTELLCYSVVAVAVVAYSAVAIASEVGLIAPACHLPPRSQPLKHGNPDFDDDPCYSVRYWSLLGFTKWECGICARILCSIAIGTAIGWERAVHGHTATGMRTMSVLCLGACCFSICSSFSFVDGPMSWDASRSSAAIPTGAGFLGGATIWKGKTASGREEIHGLTTAILVWTTAAIGNAVGGALYVPAIFAAAASVVVLNFVPGAAGIAAVGPLSAASLARDDLRRGSTARIVAGHDTLLTMLAINLIGCSACVYALLALAAPHLAPPCSEPLGSLKPYSNPIYAAEYDPCQNDRHAVLGGLTTMEADACVRLTVAVLLGAIIGHERRRSERGVGIQTMAITCLASALYTWGGMFCEGTGPSKWDTSRVAAAVVSGVSFIGGAVIVKGSDKNPHVHGLTTATSVWLSAALGLMAGGALYPVAFFAAFTAVFYLRFGPSTHQGGGSEPNGLDGQPNGGADGLTS